MVGKRHVGRLWHYKHKCGAVGIIAQSEFFRTPRYCPACRPKLSRERTPFAGRCNLPKKPVGGQHG
jgi:hypothetical protein